MKKLRLYEGRIFRKGKKWIKVESNFGGIISYNSSGTIQWAGGRCKCSRYKFIKMLKVAGYVD